MKYVLRRIEDGLFVGQSGSKNSYTTQLANARIYPSQRAAEADACGNERAIPLERATCGR